MRILLTVLTLINLHMLLHAGDAAISLLNGSSSVTEKFAVVSLTPYRLSFTAKVVGSGNFEDSPQLEYLFMYQDKAKLGRKMAGWTISFYDSSGKIIKPRCSSFWQSMFSRDFRFYQHEFYTPRDAAFLSVGFSAGEQADSLYVENLVLEKIETSKILNLNPEFKLGSYNYSGIRTLHKGKMTDDESGVVKLDMRNGWAISDLIPVNPGDSLKISISAKGYRKMGAALKFNYCDAAGKAILKDRGCLRIPQGEAKIMSYDFVVPDNIYFVEFVLGGAVYNWIKLEHILK